jgi:type III secretion protein J
MMGKLFHSLKRKLRSAAILIGLVFLLGACGQEVLQQALTEPEANEILVVLFQNGINASKVMTTGPEGSTYSVTIPKDQIQNARRVLLENNLPRARELGSEGICKEKGLIPTPEEEKCRRLLAKKGDIINSLQRIPGVIDADIVLNVPEINPFNTETQNDIRPTASSVIRVKKSVDGYEVTEARIQQFISKSVENLDPRDVSVIITYIQPPQEILSQGPKSPAAGLDVNAKLATIAGLVMKVESVKRFKIFAVIMLVLLLGVSAALILNVIKLTKMRQELKVSKLNSGLPEVAAGSPPLLEGGNPSASQLSPGEKAAAAQK